MFSFLVYLLKGIVNVFSKFFQIKICLEPEIYVSLWILYFLNTFLILKFGGFFNANRIKKNTMTLSRCTVCGLPITSKPEWDDIQFNNTYWASFKLIGDSILWSIPRGNSGAKGIQRFFNARERILKDTGLFNQPHVEIKDYSHTIGHATNAARQQFIECMKIERDRNWLKGYVGYNASLPVKLRINVGKRLYRLTFPLKLVNRYEDAVALAVNLVKTTGGTGVKNVRNRSWLLELEGYSAKFELIGDDILYNNAEGVLRAECVDPFFKFYEQVLSEAGLISKKPYFRIVNWKNLQRTAWAARKLYINRMTRLNKEIPCRYSVLYGLNGFMKTLVNSSRMFSPSLNWL